MRNMILNLEQLFDDVFTLNRLETPCWFFVVWSKYTWKTVSVWSHQINRQPAARWSPFSYDRMRFKSFCPILVHHDLYLNNLNPFLAHPSTECSVSYCDHSPSVHNFLVNTLASTNINQSAPNLVRMYMTIRSRMSSIMELIGPELPELSALELENLPHLTC